MLHWIAATKVLNDPSRVLSDVVVALFPFSTDMQDARMGAVRPFYRLGFSSSLAELGVDPAAALPVVRFPAPS
jgi:hypothetical protein